jgi:hypothetical protein
MLSTNINHSMSYRLDYSSNSYGLRLEPIMIYYS